MLEVFSCFVPFRQGLQGAWPESFAGGQGPKKGKKIPVTVFDLTKSHDFQSVCKYVEAERESLVSAHFAPSLGTASRARERSVHGIKTLPRPLRSESYPDGWPWTTKSRSRKGTRSQ